MSQSHHPSRVVVVFSLIALLTLPARSASSASDARAADRVDHGSPSSQLLAGDGGDGPAMNDTWVTFLGGAGTDSGGLRAVDGDGNIYVLGISSTTWGTPLRPFSPPAEDGWYPDVFVAKLDPAGHLIWSTFLGGAGYDYGGGLAFDSNGNIVISAESDGTWGDPDQPYSGGSDIWLASLNSEGNLLWNTFIGGNEDDAGGSLLADRDGGFYVTGRTRGPWGCKPIGCTKRPFSSGPYFGQDAFIAKLDSHGRLLWNTFLGGTKVDYNGTINIDRDSGDIIVTGTSEDAWTCKLDDCTTRSFSGRPSTDPDLFVAKLGSDGTLLWNAFLGRAGHSWSAPSAQNTASGEVFVSGTSGVAWTCSSAPCTVRAYSDYDDGFVAKLAPSGRLLWNTFLGSDETDSCDGLVLHADSSITVSGSSWSEWSCTGAPCSVRAYTHSEDAYIAKLNANGELLWNSFLGGRSIDSRTSVQIDEADRYYVTGTSEGSWGSPERVYADWDAYVAILDPSGALLWNTFVGGWERDYGSGLILDGSGRALMGSITEGTWGSPIRPYSGDRDIYVTAIQLMRAAKGHGMWLPLVTVR